MKKLLLILPIAIICLLTFSVTAYAQDGVTSIENSVNSLKDGLSDRVQKDLEDIGVTSPDIDELKDVDFQSVIKKITQEISQQSTAPLSSGAAVIAILIIYALLESYSDSLRQSSMGEVMSVITTLCITAALVVPIISLIDYSVTTVKEASDFMLIYVPIMAGVLAFSGHAVSSAGYYSLMMLSCQAVTQLSSKLIAPLLNAFLGISVCSAITERVNLKGFCALFSKVIKWLIAFVMTLFSALLTIRSMITTAYDSVTTRAVRFTLSSFIPIVGTAISEAYKTIQGSINLLKSGAGVFVILAILVVFLPVIARCLMWLLAVNICKAVGECVGIKQPLYMLSSISSVLSTVFAIIVCIMSVFIISTALLITLSGGGS